MAAELDRGHLGAQALFSKPLSGTIGGWKKVNRNRAPRKPGTTVVLVLLAALCGCGSGAPEPVVRPPAPPAPPAFQPQAVDVSLGSSGATVTLMTTEQGGYTLDGQAFASGGQVTATNGNVYVLTFSEGIWMAVFQAPDPIELQMGTSGESVTITRSEDGTYSVEDGATVTAASGNVYVLTLGEGVWTAVFQAPDPIELQMGTSGESVTITRSEDGTYSVEDGATVTAASGNVYVLTLGEGVWTAVFQAPDPIELQMGTSGESVTITRSEDGTYSVEDGATVAAASGNVYVLTLGEGVWTAVFQAPDPIELQMGTSGESVTITRSEDGTYSVEDGATVTAASGNVYVLTLGEGVWTAVFQAPDPIELQMGTSGESVTITRSEDGTYSVKDGATVTAASGNEYTLSVSADGKWRATYRARETMVDLGRNGGRVRLFREEDGGFTLDGNTVDSGTVLLGGNGAEYRLTLSANGIWSAVYQVQRQGVPLGTSGLVTLTRAEDGTWSIGNKSVENRGTVTAGNGSLYRLQYRNGYWSAAFVPERQRIAGTKLSATTREDGNGYRVGTSGLLPPRGRGDVTVDGVMYHVWEQDGRLGGARFDGEPHGKTESGGNYQIGLTKGVARLNGNDATTVANERGTALLVGGGEFPINALLDNGASSAKGENMVRQGRDAMIGIRSRAELLIAALPNSTRFRTLQLNGLWREAQSLVNGIFGRNTVDLERTTDPEEVLGAFDVLVEALSNLAAFQEATQEDGDGVFEDAALNDTAARRAFNAVASESTVVLKATGDTRYGVVKTKARVRPVTGLSFNADGADVGAFAYSTIPDTQASWLVQTTGSGVYKGGTVAVSGDGIVYTGDVELLVRFRTETVSSLFKNIKDENGEPWTYLYYPVNFISLPDARLQFDADWSYQLRGSDRASIVWQGFGGATTVRSSFAGHLVGRGANAGSQAVGVWSVGWSSDGSNYLEGGFGAERVAIRDDEQAVTVPEDQDPSIGAESRTAVVPAGTEIADGILTLRGTQYGPNLATTASQEDWADEVRLLENGRRVAEVYQISLQDAFLRQDYASSYLGRNLVNSAREEVASLRQRLAGVIDLGDIPPALRLRTEIWEQINEVVQARLFGTGDKALDGRDYRNDNAVTDDDPRKWSSGYPVLRAGRPDDTEALAAVDAVLAALASAVALEEAVKEGSGGIFTRADGSPFRPVGSEEIKDIWERAEARVNLWLGSTEYTRFGAWVKQTAPSAWSGYNDRLGNDENGPTAFAYSPLPPAEYADYRFPVGSSATYRGDTIAVQGSTFYEGKIDLIADWHLALQGQNEAGSLTAVISGLQNRAGDALSYTDPDAAGATEKFIEEIIFRNMGIMVDSQNRLYFSDDNPSDVTIGFTRRTADLVSLSDDPSVAISIEGKFVGKTFEGPQGMIGIWTLRDSGDTKIGTGDKVHGAFGAELEP